MGIGAGFGIGWQGLSDLKPRSLHDIFYLMELKSLNGHHAPAPS